MITRFTADITSGKLKPGARLPTEQELIAATGVSRTVVREAVAALRADGLVVTRQGVGAFVADHVRRPFRIEFDELHTLREVLEVMELRTGIEIEAAGLAAERATPAQLKRIGDCFEEIGGALRGGASAVDEDYAFHCSIAEATNNPQFKRFIEYLGRFMIPRQTVKGGPSASRTAPILKRCRPSTGEILAAIRQRSLSAGARGDAPAPAQQPPALPAARCDVRVGVTAASNTNRHGHGMNNILVTGAAGGIGTRLRSAAARAYTRDPVERHRARRTISARTRNSSWPISPT